MIRSLNRKLSLALLLIVISIGTAALLVGQWGMRLYYEELTQKLNASIAMYITDTHELIEGQVGSNEALRLLANRAMIINPTVEVYVLDPAGLIIAHTLQPHELNLNRIELEPIKQFIGNQAQFPIRASDPRHNNVRRIFSAAAVMNDNKLQGYVYVVLGSRLYDDVRQEIAWGHIQMQVLIALVIIIISCLVLGVLIFRMLIRPLKDLSTRMTLFATDTLGTGSQLIEQQSNTDEIERLQLVFQAMTMKISLQLEQLRESDRMRRELVSNISHDLRTPLASIQGYIETLMIKQDSLPPNQHQDYLQSAAKGCNRLARLISDLFELSKLESGVKQPAFEHFSILELMYDTVQGFQLTAERRNISLEVNCPHHHLMVYADIGMIQQVFDNLLRNALTHTPDHGHIQVIFHETAKGINVTVEDTGHGIDSRDLPNIFNRHYQSCNSTELQGRKSGIGLGLAIVKRILEIHGSAIEVSSKINEGTRFRFTLPADD